MVLFHVKICRFAFIAKQRPAEAVKEAVAILGDIDWIEASDWLLPINTIIIRADYLHRNVGTSIRGELLEGSLINRTVL